MQLLQVVAGPFRVVECSSGPFGAPVCSPFAPRTAPRLGEAAFRRALICTPNSRRHGTRTGLGEAATSNDMSGLTCVDAVFGTHNRTRHMLAPDCSIHATVFSSYVAEVGVCGLPRWRGSDVRGVELVERYHRDRAPGSDDARPRLLTLCAGHGVRLSL